MRSHLKYETEKLMRIYYSYHGDSGDVLLLLHVDVSDIQPDVRKICRRLANLSEDISRLIHQAFVCKDAAFRQTT